MTLDGSGSSAPGGSIVGYQWDLGDGATASGMTVQHTYQSAGAYTALLTVTASNGKSSATSVRVSVVAPPLPPTGSATAFVTGVVPGTLRNDFSGYVGMRIVVGTNPIAVTALGRMMASDNSGEHLAKLVQAADGTDVPGGSVLIATRGGAAGRFQYAALSSPVTLATGATYYVVSQETPGGDTWYNWDTMVTTTGVATESGPIWGYGPGQWHEMSAGGQAYVPVDFKYADVSNPPPAAASYVTGTVLGTLRNDYSGFVGVQVVVGANPITITDLGRIVASGNSGTHTVKLVQASDGTDVPGGSVSIATSGEAAGQFLYGTLSTPVTLAAGATYYVVSQETPGGDTWYNWDTEVTTAGVAEDNAVVWGTGPSEWNTYAAVNHAFVPVDFKYR